MIIDTTREPSNYQDDHSIECGGPETRLELELMEKRMERAYRRKCKTWNWDLEIEFREEQEHLIEAIQEEKGIW